MANYVPYTSSANCNGKKSSTDPYAPLTSTATSTSTSTSTTVPASEHDPYAKYDNISSATTAGINSTPSYSAASPGYDPYGNTTNSNTSKTPAEEYNPYAKYDNMPSAQVAGTGSTATQPLPSSTASSGYDPYGYPANNIPASEYDPYKKYDDIPSAATTAAAPIMPQAIPPTAQNLVDDGFTTAHQSSFPPLQQGVVLTTQEPNINARGPENIQVTIPTGVSSGQTIQIRAPDGRQKEFIVPEGYGPGSTLVVDFNSQSAAATTMPIAATKAPNNNSLSQTLTSSLNSTLGNYGDTLGKHGITIPGGKTSQPASSTSALHPAPSPSIQSTAISSNFAPIAPQYATNQPTELYLKEKTLSFTGDDAKIKDGNGNLMFKVEAKLLTFSQARNMHDSHGNIIGTLQHKKFDFAPTIYIGTPANNKKVSLKTTGMFNPLNCNASISINGAKVGKVKGNWRAKKFSVEINGSNVATIGRKTTMAALFMDADSYAISVTPQGEPVDLAFISLIATGLDELYHDK